jgi:hypothetical protein
MDYREKAQYYFDNNMNDDVYYLYEKNMFVMPSIINDFSNEKKIFFHRIIINQYNYDIEIIEDEIKIDKKSTKNKIKTNE